MAKVKKGDDETYEVYTTDAPSESLEGTVYRLNGEHDGWEAQCHLEAGARFRGESKKEAVDLLDDHFLRAHTTVYG